jgi:hypothetical protein
MEEIAEMVVESELTGGGMLLSEESTQERSDKRWHVSLRGSRKKKKSSNKKKKHVKETQAT